MTTPTGRLSESEIEVIRERCEHATPGPWSEFCESSDWWIETGTAADGPTGQVIADANAMSAGDMLFIAHARTDVPRLLAELAAREAENARLRDLARLLTETTEAFCDRPVTDYEVSLRQHARALMEQARQALADAGAATRAGEGEE